MPDPILQLEELLEPFVERFDTLAASAVNRPAAAAVIKRLALQAPLMRLVAWLDRLAAGFLLRTAFVFRANEAAPRTLAFRGPLDAFSHVVAVVAAVGGDVLGGLGKLVDLAINGLGFLGAGGGSRGQQGKDRRVFRGRDHDFH